MLQEIVRKRKLPKFYKGDFMKLNIREGYDILMLSNIYQYLDCGIEEFMKQIDKYGKVDTLAKYSWEFLREEEEFIDQGFEASVVDGTYTNKNYILSLRRR